MKKQDKYSLWFYLAVFAFMIGLQVFLFPSSHAAKQQLSYKQFKEQLAKGDIERVVIQQDKILGIFKDSTRTSDTSNISSGPTAPWRLRMQEIENQMRRQFIVNRLPNVDDDQLLYQLDKANVDYLGNIENNFLNPRAFSKLTMSPI